MIKGNNVIVIDSFAKLKELDNKLEVDTHLRKKYNGKLFLIVFQQTTDGKMRGGSKSGFDGDCIFFVEKDADFKKNIMFTRIKTAIKRSRWMSCSIIFIRGN